MFFGVSSSVTECFQSVTDYLQPVTELGTPKNMAAALPGMTLQPHLRAISSDAVVPEIIYSTIRCVMIPYCILSSLISSSHGVE